MIFSIFGNFCNTPESAVRLSWILASLIVCLRICGRKLAAWTDIRLSYLSLVNFDYVMVYVVYALLCGLEGLKRKNKSRL